MCSSDLLDTTEIVQHLHQQKSGQTVHLSLCGDSQAMTFESARSGFLTRIMGFLSPQRTSELLKQL